MAWPKSTELAILTVNGQNYQDWESVTVRHAHYQAPYFTFRFTCSEGAPLSKNWAAMRIRPGDACTITLAGQLAFAGLVHTRQVFYDGRRHYIEIQGASNVLILSYATVAHKTNEENNITYEKYARKLLSPHKISLVIEGGVLPNKEIDRLSTAPGTTVMEALEIPLRSLGGFALTSNVKSDLVVIAGPSGGADTVTEGVNILEGREIIYNPGMAQGIASSGQAPGGDQKNGAAVAQMFSKNTGQSVVSQFVPQNIPLEIPAFAKDMLTGRGNADRDWQNEDYITVFVTVQGWLRPGGGGLWYRNQQVNVISPMLIMDGDEDLHARTVTFTQDNRSGTRTVLELCNKLAMSQVAQGGTGGG